jgi:Ca2+-binding RTX toxin-like protein
MGIRAILLIAVLLVALGGVALAETLTGSKRDDRLIGSNHRDSISGGGGEALIKGLRAIDSLNGGAGATTSTPAPGTKRRGIPSSLPPATTL